MWGYPLKAKQSNFPKHIKKSYANGLWQRSCGCIVVLICIHCGSSWQDPLFAFSLNLRAHLEITSFRVNTGTSATALLLTLQLTLGSNSGGGGVVCVFRRQSVCQPSKAKKGLASCLSESTDVHRHLTTTTIITYSVTNMHCLVTMSSCIFALQILTSHQNFLVLREREKETAKGKESKAQSGFCACKDVVCSD